MSEYTIVRKWELVRNKGTEKEAVFKLGLDINGNLFGYCENCQQNMLTMKDYDLRSHTITMKLKCIKCNAVIDANARGKGYLSRM